ncbi:ImmA/IrrE family metallo-endopeptidase [Citrobacter amalonaticus]
MELFDSENDYRGDCLKLARLAKGVSGEELATVLGVTKQFISKLERGYPPAPSAISLLAHYLDVEESFFFSTRLAPLDSDHCHFRSKRSRTQALTNSILARAEILDKLIGNIEKEIILPTLDIPDTSSMPLKSDADIERVAEECRRYWGLGLGPISSMVNFVESIGIVVAHVSDVDDRIDAFTVNNKRPLIIRNSAKKSVCRFRSDLGHELGHLVLHEGVVTGDKLTEHQADHYSSAFMVPRVSFINEFPKMRGTHLDWNAIIDFKLRWKISLRMCLYRASVLGLISPQQMRTGFIHLNSKGFTKDEKGDELIVAEEPKMLSQAIDLLDPFSWKQVLEASSLKHEFVCKMFGIAKPLPPSSDNLVSLHKYKKFG